MIEKTVKRWYNLNRYYLPIDMYICELGDVVENFKIHIIKKTAVLTSIEKTVKVQNELI